MNFEKAILIQELSEQRELIENEIYGYDWSFELCDGLPHGGWPVEIKIEKIMIRDEVDEFTVAIVKLSFDESVATGCKDINHTYPMERTITVRIDKTDGHHDIEQGPVDELDEADGVYFYPDDYN